MSTPDGVRLGPGFEYPWLDYRLRAGLDLWLRDCPRNGSFCVWGEELDGRVRFVLVLRKVTRSQAWNTAYRKAYETRQQDDRGSR